MEKDIKRLMEERHSVRQFQKQAVSEEHRKAILAYLAELKAESGLDIRFVENGRAVFGSVFLKLIGWKNPPQSYFAFVGPRTPETEEKCGYYGEKLVLYVQSLGLNTCWVGMFDRRSAADGTIVTIAVGYGLNSGKPRRSKTPEQVSQYTGEVPAWFAEGVECALLAPTAVNRQAFLLRGDGDRVYASCHNGAYSNIDLGIVKYHFEQGAGKENFHFHKE